MILLAAIPPPPGDAIEVGPLTVHFYGVAIAIGILVAITVLRRRYAGLGGDPELSDRVALWAVAFGFVGARLAWVSTNLDRFADRPWAVVAVWEGGLAFFGGLLLGGLAGAWFLRRGGGSLATFADAAAPVLPLAQAFGRWGNYFNQELFGTPTTLPWALEVEARYRPPQYAEFSTFHPTFLYESLYNLALAGFLVWLGRRGTLRRGSLIFVYGMGYGTIRFLLELIRTDTTFRLFGLSRNAYVALGLLAASTVALVVWQRRSPAEPEAAEEVEPGGAGTEGAEPADAKAADVEAADVEPSDVEPADAEPDGAASPRPDAGDARPER